MIISTGENSLDFHPNRNKADPSQSGHQRLARRPIRERSKGEKRTRTAAFLAVLLFTYSGAALGQTWNEQQKLTARDAAAEAWFGISVSVNGDTVVIGAYRDGDLGTDSGSAYVFVRRGATWSEQQKLTASDAAAEDMFGNSVSVSGDTAVIGVDRDDDDGTDSGSAYIFVRSGETWREQQKLTARDAEAGHMFGRSVSVSGDTAVIGAYGDASGGTDSGSAYVFVRSGDTWSEQQKLTASDAEAGDLFGIAVSVSGDTAVIGACRDDEDGTDSGSAYVFVRSGETWSEQQELTASDAGSEDRFGFSVSVSGDTAVIGAYADDDDESGSAYVFVRGGETWSEQQKLTASDAGTEDRFGLSVSVSGDTAVIGAYADDDGGVDTGSAYVFVRSGVRWDERKKLMASDAAIGDFFGTAVSVSGDTAVIGAFGNDDAGLSSGSAYIYACDLPPYQGNVLRASKSGDDVLLDFAGAPATNWRVYRDTTKSSIGLTEHPPETTSPAFTDQGAVPVTAGERLFYCIKGVNGCGIGP